VEHRHGRSRQNLLWRQQQSVCLHATSRDTHSYSYGVAYTYSDFYSNCYRHSHCYSDSDCNFYSNIDPNGHRDWHANIDPNCHGNFESDSDTQTNAHSETPCDTEAAADSTAKAHAVTSLVRARPARAPNVGCAIPFPILPRSTPAATAMRLY
jgi:hypothetical protein